MLNTIQFNTLYGKDILTCINDIAKLRMMVFREYPYLYDGNQDYEQAYLTRYTQHPDSILITAIDTTCSQIIGASTGMPMSHEMPEVIRPFSQRNYAINTIFFLGETVILPQYRGLGLYKFFMQKREQQALKAHCSMSCFCAIERETNHPKRPNSYKSPALMWQKYGYTPHPELATYYEYQEIGKSSPEKNKMVFWLKQLESS